MKLLFLYGSVRTVLKPTHTIVRLTEWAFRMNQPAGTYILVLMVWRNQPGGSLGSPQTAVSLVIDWIHSQ